MATGEGFGVTNSQYFWTGQASNLDSSAETTFNTFTLAPAAFLRDGDSIAFEYWGTFSGDTGVQIVLKAGSSTLLDTGVIDPGNESWSVRGRFVRTSATSQKSFAEFSTKGTALSTTMTSDTTFVLTSSVVFTLTGIGVAVDDLKLNGVYITRNGGPS